MHLMSSLNCPLCLHVLLLSSFLPKAFLCLCFLHLSSQCLERAMKFSFSEFHLWHQLGLSLMAARKVSSFLLLNHPAHHAQRRHLSPVMPLSCTHCDVTTESAWVGKSVPTSVRSAHFRYSCVN